jgi:hypothetical protein
LSVIIHNFHGQRIFAVPAKTNPPLVIYADAVLAFAVVFQRFQMVAIRHAQIIQAARLVQHHQFPPRHALNLHRQPPRRFVVEQLFRFAAREAAYHSPTTITPPVIDVKRKLKRAYRKHRDDNAVRRRAIPPNHQTSSHFANANSFNAADFQRADFFFGKWER